MVGRGKAHRIDRLVIEQFALFGLGADGLAGKCFISSRGGTQVVLVAIAQCHELDVPGGQFVQSLDVISAAVTDADHRHADPVVGAGSRFGDGGDREHRSAGRRGRGYQKRPSRLRLHHGSPDECAVTVANCSWPVIAPSGPTRRWRQLSELWHCSWPVIAPSGPARRRIPEISDTTRPPDWTCFADSCGALVQRVESCACSQYCLLFGTGPDPGHRRSAGGDRAGQCRTAADESHPGSGAAGRGIGDGFASVRPAYRARQYRHRLVNRLAWRQPSGNHSWLKSCHPP